MRVPIIKHEIPIPEGVSISYENNILKVKGPKGEVERKFYHPLVKLSVQDNKIVLETYFATRREKRLINTWKAHINNMLKGVQEPFVYKLKICYSHFPMKVKLEGNKIIVENFLGEKSPRVKELPYMDKVKVQIKGEEIIVESPDKEKAGIVASMIEQVTRNIGRKDRRKFIDGIWIYYKAGKSLVEE